MSSVGAFFLDPNPASQALNLLRMLAGLIFASVIAGAGAPAPQSWLNQASREQQKPDDKAPFVAPTPWFNKDEDTFDPPADLKRRELLAKDAKDGRADAIDAMREVKPSTN